MPYRTAQYQWPEGLPTPSSGRVLVVDEDCDDLEYYSVLLEADGYKVLRSSCHEGGLQLVEHCDFAWIT